MARIVVTNGPERGREFELSSEQHVGRLASNELAFDDSRMSRQNTRIYFLAQGWWIEDLESKNGTFVNGKQITKTRLSNDDEIRVGETYFSFLMEGDNPEVLASPAGIQVAASSKDLKSKPASDRVLSFSKNAEATSTSMMWLRQDLGQRSSGFRMLMIVGAILMMIAFVWLIQSMIVGG